MVTTKIMRNTTALKPRDRPRRDAGEIVCWRRKRERWMASLEPTGMFQRLFDHIPGVYFFAKDGEGNLMFANEGLLRRYQMPDDSEFIGQTDFDLNPDSMAQAYVDDDKRILSGEAKRVERIELWWDSQGMPDWFLVTKLPLVDKRGRIQGVMGLLRRPDDAERKLPVFQTVARAVEIIRGDFAQPLKMDEVAIACGQSLRQLQRHFQSAFGISPQDFLIKTRLLAAIKLLESTTLPLSEIARRCGFVDQSAFAQHFRRRMGVTPGVYRKRAAGGG